MNYPTKTYATSLIPAEKPDSLDVFFFAANSHEGARNAVTCFLLSNINRYKGADKIRAIGGVSTIS